MHTLMGLSFLLGSNHYSISWWDFTTTPVLYKNFLITQNCRRHSMAHLQNKYLRVTFLPKSHRSFLYYGIKSWPMLKTAEGILWLICKINNQGLQLHHLTQESFSTMEYGLGNLLKTAEGIIRLVCKINNQGLQLRPSHIGVFFYYGVRSWQFAQDCRRHPMARLQNK